MLLMAAIENLATCPFCQYAAEYPPVEENREFYCLAPDCGKVSCRMCNLESHIPKSCKEHAKDNGLSALRVIEEAMSAALIRKCNKCEAPFVKEDGCNKMTCSRCRNIQCYVCSVSLPPNSAYGHFDEKARGGKEGNCPLFENLEERHKTDVGKAEREALEKIRAEHPEVDEEQLKVTDNVPRRNPPDALPHPPDAPLLIPAPPPPRLRLNFGQ
jgi:TRIAD3 protein (E3 ubiquitin-protein ligase RNF216)